MSMNFNGPSPLSSPSLRCLACLYRHLESTTNLVEETEAFDREGLVRSIRESVVGCDHMIGGPYGPKKVLQILFFLIGWVINLIWFLLAPQWATEAWRVPSASFSTVRAALCDLFPVLTIIFRSYSPCAVSSLAILPDQIDSWHAKRNK